MSNHVQHVIKIFQALPLLIFYSVKGRGEPGSRLLRILSPACFGGTIFSKLGCTHTNIYFDDLAHVWSCTLYTPDLYKMAGPGHRTADL